MAAIFSISFASSAIGAHFHRTKFNKPMTFVNPIRCTGRLEWDPEGVLGAPQTGHIARLEFKRRLEQDAAAREEFERQVREERERRRVLRESRVIPDTVEELVEFFLDTEAQEIEFEIARLRPRLNKEFFDHLQVEVGKLRFSMTKTQEVEDRLIELEALQKALQEATEAYDKMQADIVSTKKNLTEILTSKDVKATLLELVERNELNRPLLTLLDENIATAHSVNQKQAAEYMEKLRGLVLKYLTV
ncbi:uncharacterized protein LOC107801093 isoform X1 [Nicotiana tabacum]|uniref:Uncharacterized protein LOC107801093 isoform X1 n=1 Tax=Nicotiana tabacum TaxID=4097 RepID=A0A1S4AT44_TOBAC|nr:uncharacterized protein LOC104104568 isoform X1 [Nicotiana tomentosiformis]XP_016479854.1 PREDICTED: uncharacterized protein LOC107801093 isoform X1 [Nicotiana tabacum]